MPLAPLSTAACPPDTRLVYATSSSPPTSPFKSLSASPAAAHAPAAQTATPAVKSSTNASFTRHTMLAGHATGAVEFSGQYMRDVHSSATSVPSCGQKKPSGHAPGRTLLAAHRLPAGQGCGAELLVGQKPPAEQGCATELLPGQNLPAGQDAGWLARTPHRLPAGQANGTPEPAGQYVPPTQSIPALAFAGQCLPPAHCTGAAVPPGQ